MRESATRSAQKRKNIPDWNRTSNLRLRRPTLYPIELREHDNFASGFVGKHCIPGEKHCIPGGKHRTPGGKNCPLGKTSKQQTLSTKKVSRTITTRETHLVFSWLPSETGNPGTMRERGLEPPREKISSGPQPDASANSAIPANDKRNITPFLDSVKGPKREERRNFSLSLRNPFPVHVYVCHDGVMFSLR